MANVNAPKGLSPVRNGDGSPWNGAANMYYIVSTDTNAYYIGDVVLSAAGADANGVPAVVKDTAGTATLRGVIVGIVVAPSGPTSLNGSAQIDLTTRFIPATKAKDYYVLVCDDPNTIFEVQGDATATLQVAASANKNCSLTIAAPTAPDAYSATVINSGSILAANTLNIKLMGLAQREGNGFGAYAAWLCKINLHELGGPGTTGV